MILLKSTKRCRQKVPHRADYEYYCAGTAVCSGLSIYHNTNRGIHGVNLLMLSTEVLLNENQTRRGWETSSVGGENVTIR